MRFVDAAPAAIMPSLAPAARKQKTDRAMAAMALLMGADFETEIAKSIARRASALANNRPQRQAA